MTTLLVDSASLKATDVRVSDDTLSVELADGRSVSVPLAWYPRLLHGTLSERSNYRLIGGGEGIHWPALDEDISVEGLLAGRASGERGESLRRWLESRRK
ncbi:MAG: DUF2442 domain-containing protein [Verrucomicrobia bacterium]|nr:DUF2442 domain-containing protein [Verrucomicrobiota bacterium]